MLLIKVKVPILIVMEWFSEIWASLTLVKVLIGIGMFLLSFTVSLAAVGFVMVRIPADYFCKNAVHSFMSGKPKVIRWSAVILKNVVGFFLILLGVVLSLPGVPGQGILTILLGLIMLDIPGKRPLEAKIIKRPAILSAVNKLREKYQKPPLLID